TIVVSIEAKRRPDGSYEAYVDNGRERTGLEALAWAQRVVELGAGELIVTSIDREGTGSGFDLELIQAVAQLVPVPVIACGGAGTAAHVIEAVMRGRADAVSVASLLHYEFVQRNPQPGGAPGGQPRFSRRPGVSLPELKQALASHGIPAR